MGPRLTHSSKGKARIKDSEAMGLPIVFEEELAFTETFIKRTGELKINPHLGC